MSDLLLCSHFLNQITKTRMLHLLGSGNDTLVPRPCPVFFVACNTKKQFKLFSSFTCGESLGTRLQ